MRAIVTPPVLSPAALAELKDWLAVTTDTDDTPLSGLLRAALDSFEAFTGIMPLAAQCEEVLAACPDWQTLATRPVLAVGAVETIAADDARTLLPVQDYTVALDADGAARLRLGRPADTGRIAVRFTAGLAAGWEDLPAGLRHGAIRLAAHGWRQRDADALGSLPPAAVAALWRPWRRTCLA